MNKILISHRGNINGKIEKEENKPSYIEEEISLGYDVEIDVWVKEGKIFLGHDAPEYETTTAWLLNRCASLWVHCKNIEAVEYFHDLQLFNYFWHQEDTVTLTSKGYIWAYPNKQPIKKSIAVLPELHNDDISLCSGICSDYIIKYKDEKFNRNLLDKK